MAALQIVEQVGSGTRRRRRNACGHEVGRGGLRNEHPVGELHQLAHRTHRSDVGLPRGPAGDQREQEGHSHREHAVDHRHVKVQRRNRNHAGPRQQAARDEPAHRNFDLGRLRFMRLTRRSAPSGQPLEGPHDGAPLGGK